MTEDEHMVNDKEFLLCKKCHKGYMEPAKDKGLFEFLPKTMFRCNLCGHIEYRYCCPR